MSDFGNSETVTQQPRKLSDETEANDVRFTNRPKEEEDLRLEKALGKIPNGLKILQSCDEIEFRQDIGAMELVGCGRQGSYKIYTPGSNEHFLYLYEVSDCMARQCLGAGRGFVGKIKDNEDQYIASVNRALTFSRGCFCSCLKPSMTVCFPIPFQIGTITERSTCLRPAFDILDAQGEQLFFFKNDCYYLKECLWFMNVAISIYDRKGDLVAQIIKNSFKNAEEFLGFQNNITIKFLVELEVKYKILILGACLMVNLNNFESDRRMCC